MNIFVSLGYFNSVVILSFIYEVITHGLIYMSSTFFFESIYVITQGLIYMSSTYMLCIIYSYILCRYSFAIITAPAPFSPMPYNS